jgi:hypothetical protein
MPYIIDKVLTIYKKLTNNVDLKIGAHYHALSNYNAQLTDVKLIDINKFVKLHTPNMSALTKAC